MFQFSGRKGNRGIHALFNAKLFLCVLHSSAGAGTNDICALRFAEGTEAAVDVFGSHSEMIGGAGLELGQCAGHWKWKRFQHPNFLPVLLCCVTIGVVLMEGVEMIAVDRGACLVGLCHTPGQHDTSLT